MLSRLLRKGDPSPAVLGGKVRVASDMQCCHSLEDGEATSPGCGQTPETGVGKATKSPGFSRKELAQLTL